MASTITAGPRLPPMVAVQAVLLRPTDRGGEAVREPGLWPVFAMVLAERDLPDDPPGWVLSDLLGRLSEEARVVVVDGWCGWTVQHSDRALLRFWLRARAPRGLDLDILLPAAPIRDLLDVLSGGVTVGITTQRHAWPLDGAVDARTALRRLLLVRCPPSDELRRACPAA